jgi:cytochrome c-type biogenesis protein CcmH/NrfF
MNRSRLLAIAVAAITTVGTTLMLSSAGVAATPDFSAVMSQFMCVSCHEPLELVSSPQAISEKQTLKGFVDQRLTMAEIKRAMVGQYGTAVLARPPASGFDLTVYILPPAVFVGGLALLAYTLPKWRARSRRAAATPIAGTAPLEPDEAKRLDDELTNFI